MGADKFSRPGGEIDESFDRHGFVQGEHQRPRGFGSRGPRRAARLSVGGSEDPSHRRRRRRHRRGFRARHARADGERSLHGAAGTARSGGLGAFTGPRRGRGDRGGLGAAAGTSRAAQPAPYHFAGNGRADPRRARRGLPLHRARPGRQRYQRRRHGHPRRAGGALSRRRRRRAAAPRRIAGTGRTRRSVAP